MSSSSDVTVAYPALTRLGVDLYPTLRKIESRIFLIILWPEKCNRPVQHSSGSTAGSALS